MDFSLSDEQQMLKRSASDFLKKEFPMKLVREMVNDEKGYSPELWQKMAELGWQGLMLPAEYGGTDLSFFEITLLLEEMGYALLPSPFFASVILGGLSVLEAGSKEQKQKYLPKVAEGNLLLTLAITELATRYEVDPASINVKATRHQDYYIINGIKLFVPYAHVADYMICVTRTGDKGKANEGITAFIIDAKSPGITCTPLNTIGQDRQCEVKFENVKVTEKDILGKPDNGWRYLENVLQKATAALCAYMNGAMQRILEMTVDYAKQRVQFGRPIGGFQAIQYRCADILIDLEVSRVLTCNAAYKISHEIHCPREVSTAKAWASEAYRRATWYSMQVHGGVGCDIEHDLPLFYQRAKADEVTLGDTERHRELIASELLD
jgi:alkylation response protein AidB-like acyl-CoA dehydrogenase